VPGEYYVFGLRFVPLITDAKVFGFSEYIAGLALMALVWTIADSRYKFRIDVAPLSPRGTTYAVVAGIGLLTLLTDVWRASKLPVPEGHLITPACWQGLLGGLYLLTFLAWAFFAFLRPWRFGRMNARRFTAALSRIMLRGSPVDLAIIADELCGSAAVIVRHATEMRPKSSCREKGKPQQKPRLVEGYANDIFMMFGDKRFCSAVVESSPQFVWAIFTAMQQTKRYHVPVRVFASNLLNAALANKNSFIYHETQAGYRSGFFGYAKPITQAMFSNYELVDAVGTMLTTDYSSRRGWDSNQWEAYCCVVSIAMKDFIARDMADDPSPLYRALSDMEETSSSLGSLNGVPYSEATSEATRCLMAVTKFVVRTIKDLDAKPLPIGIKRKVDLRHSYTIFDALAQLVFETIARAGRMRSPVSECWTIQYNSVWGALFESGNFGGPAGKMVKAKVYRLIWGEILKMQTFPNFYGAGILGLCLNVFGLRVWPGSYRDLSEKALHKATLCWTRRNYVWLHAERPNVAAAALVDGMNYDTERRWIVRTRELLLERKPTVSYLTLDTTRTHRAH
jgi:hypothetical protein